MIDWFSADQNN